MIWSYGRLVICSILLRVCHPSRTVVGDLAVVTWLVTVVEVMISERREDRDRDRDRDRD